MKRILGSLEISVVKGDISESDADAIVNAANSRLWMGAGVAGAIKRRGGTIIEEEAMVKGPINPGEAVITSGGKLKAKNVVHCAGMAPNRKATTEYVADSVKAGLELADTKGAQTIAIPAIGAGVGGLDYEQSASAILEGISEFASEAESLKKIILVAYSDDAKEVFEQQIEHLEQ
ncbi:MAG: macro domain-containing protein [Candidatus Thorarchaeota archaeon]